MQTKTVVLNDRTEVDVTLFTLVIRQRNMLGSMNVVNMTKAEFIKLMVAVQADEVCGA